jgi:hypothetical protein
LVIGEAMRTAAKSIEMDKRVTNFFCDCRSDAPSYSGFVLGLWKEYLALGLPNDHFVGELTSGDRSKLHQRVWEMLLARHLNALGYHLSSLNEGPDLRFEHNGLTVWVEAIAPEPRGIPEDYLEMPKAGECKVDTVPHEEILLRWTAAFKEKFEKLVVDQNKGVVRATDAYVIAINGCQLGRIALNEGHLDFPTRSRRYSPLVPSPSQLMLILCK